MALDDALSGIPPPPKQGAFRTTAESLSQSPFTVSMPRAAAETLTVRRDSWRAAPTDCAEKRPVRLPCMIVFLCLFDLVCLRVICVPVIVWDCVCVCVCVIT